ncbi:hypothetical protein HDU67_007050 [Dinochytrium kinnereticum]|nr:hypothetical protein HDU67_007050 [Dinochytrium kinnereticum]
MAPNAERNSKRPLYGESDCDNYNDDLELGIFDGEHDQEDAQSTITASMYSATDMTEADSSNQMNPYFAYLANNDSAIPSRSRSPSSGSASGSAPSSSSAAPLTTTAYYPYPPPTLADTPESAIVADVYRDMSASAEPSWMASTSGTMSLFDHSLVDELSADLAEMRAMIEMEMDGLYPQNETEAESPISVQELTESAQQFADAAPEHTAWARLGPVHEGQSCRSQTTREESAYLSDATEMQSLHSHSDSETTLGEEVEIVAADGLDFNRFVRGVLDEVFPRSMETVSADDGILDAEVLNAEVLAAGKQTAMDFIMPEIQQRSALTPAEARAVESGEVEGFQATSVSDFECEALDDFVDAIAEEGATFVERTYYASPQGVASDAVFDSSDFDNLAAIWAAEEIESGYPAAPSSYPMAEFYERDVLTRYEIESLYTLDDNQDRQIGDEEVAAIVANGEAVARSSLVMFVEEIASADEREVRMVEPEVVLQLEARVEEIHESFGSQSASEAEVDAQSDLLAVMVDKVLAASNYVNRLLTHSFHQNPVVHTESILSDLSSNVHRATTKPVDSSEILKMLLTEARRIQWNKAVEEASGAPSSVKVNAATSIDRSIQKTMPAGSEGEGELVMKDVYSNGFTGGLDTDSALEAVLKEAMRLLELKASQKIQKRPMAKL